MKSQSGGDHLSPKHTSVFRAEHRHGCGGNYPPPSTVVPAASAVKFLEVIVGTWGPSVRITPLRPEEILLK